MIPIFAEPARILAKSVLRPAALLHCLILAMLPALPAPANDFKCGPLIDLSDPDPFIGCPGGLPFASDDEQVESCISVSPANPKNIVTAWIGGKVKGIVAGVTFDGGNHWRQVVPPGLTHCTGGTLDAAVDPWLSFAPNGDVYLISAQFTYPDANAIVVTKSSDGGLRWSSPIVLAESTDPRFINDKPSIAADPTDSRFVYAVWNHSANGNRGPAGLSRTTDGGHTWEPARVLFDAGTSDQVNDPTILVSPGGTVLAFFIELRFANANGGSQKDGILTLIRSVDKGQTWSSAIPVARVPATIVTNPDTSDGVASLGSFPQFFSAAVDAHDGRLCAVWEDMRFSGGQYTSIAFATSADGGFTWSTPIPINKTPNNIASGNRQAFLPAVAVAADGTIGVSYYDFRNNTAAAGVPTDHWLVHCHSTVTGPATDPRSWTNETRLTDGGFKLETVHFQFGEFFMGDYTGLAAAGNDFVTVFNMASASDSDSVFFRRVGP